MKTQSFQDRLDHIIDRLILWAIPRSLKPNYFSYLRILSVPIIYVLLVYNYQIWAFILFVLSVCTDFIDGALARTRNQVTDLGKLLDPLADKMLILTVLAFIGFEYWIVWVFAIFIAFEIVAVLGSALFAKYLGKSIGANVFGKIKMVLQSISVGLFLIGLIMDSKHLVLYSEYILGIALVFAALAGLEQLRRRIVIWQNKKGTV